MTCAGRVLLLAGLALLAVSSASAAATREEVEQDLKLTAVNPRAAFERWVKEHGAKYEQGSEEWESRFHIWMANLEAVTEHNKKGESHWLAMNAFADMTFAEFQSKYLNLKYDDTKRAVRSTGFDHATVDLTKQPKAIDWSKKNAVTEVKTQGDCGACWSFSTTGAVEGIFSIRTGELVSLSEQELIDCDTGDDAGCNGGWMDYAFEWIIQNGGITTEKEYPYVQREERCEKKKLDDSVVTIDGFQDVPPGQDSLLKAVSQQPVSSAIRASDFRFQLYGGGVYKARCGTELDHGVLVTGYSLHGSEPYFIVKNSWGSGWGEDGFFRLALNKNDDEGECGITKAPTYPVMKKKKKGGKKHHHKKKGHKKHHHHHHHKPGPPTPPAPPPAPPSGQITCDENTKCTSQETCCCEVLVKKKCIQYGCCPYPKAVCCDDHQHCCPSGTTCDLDHLSCKKGVISIPMAGTAPTTSRWGVSQFFDGQTLIHGAAGGDSIAIT